MSTQFSGDFSADVAEQAIVMKKRVFPHDARSVVGSGKLRL